MNLSVLKSSAAGRCYARVRDCVKGVAAVEFGLLIPVLTLFWLGSNEFGQALMLDRRVTTTTSTIADLVAQSPALTEAQLTEILNLSDELMAPALMSLYKSSGFRITLMNVSKDDSGDMTVEWAREKDSNGTRPSTQYADGQGVTAAEIDSSFDANIILERSSQIIAKAEYDYTPTVGRIIKRDFGGTITLKEIFFLAPRRGNVDLNP